MCFFGCCFFFISWFALVERVTKLEPLFFSYVNCGQLVFSFVVVDNDERLKWMEKYERESGRRNINVPIRLICQEFFFRLVRSFSGFYYFLLLFDDTPLLINNGCTCDVEEEK